MARCSFPHNQMANNFAIGIAGPFELGSLRRVELELGLNVVTLSMFLNRVSQIALAPWVDFAHFTAQRIDERAYSLSGLVAFLRAGAAAEDPHDFVISQFQPTRYLVNA